MTICISSEDDSRISIASTDLISLCTCIRSSYDGRFSSTICIKYSLYFIKNRKKIKIHLPFFHQPIFQQCLQ